MKSQQFILLLSSRVSCMDVQSILSLFLLLTPPHHLKKKPNVSMHRERCTVVAGRVTNLLKKIKKINR